MREMTEFDRVLAQAGDAGSGQSGGTPTGGSPPVATESTTAAPSSAPATGPAARPASPDFTFQLFFGLMIALFVFFMVSRSKRDKREREKRAAMLTSLTKNDRVMTIGGVIGTVVSAKEGTVVLKVDESTNTRMTFARRAIQQVLTGDEEPKLEEAR